MSLSCRAGDCFWNVAAHAALLESVCSLLAPGGAVWSAHCHHWEGHEAADEHLFARAAACGLDVAAVPAAGSEMRCLFGEGSQLALVRLHAAAALSVSWTPR